MPENPVCPRCGMELLEWMITTNDEEFYKTFKFYCGTILHCDGSIDTSNLCDKRFLVEKLKAIRVELEYMKSILGGSDPFFAVTSCKVHLESALEKVKECQ